MDTYNTRTPIGAPPANASTPWDSHPAPGPAGRATAPAGTAPATCTSPTRELSSIPPRIAERASRIGYKLKSYITWRKHASTPEPTKSRVFRQAEYILHLSIDPPHTSTRRDGRPSSPTSAGHLTASRARKLPTSGRSRPPAGKTGTAPNFHSPSPHAASRSPAATVTSYWTRSSARAPLPSPQPHSGAGAWATTSASPTSRSPNSASRPLVRTSSTPSTKTSRHSTARSRTGARHRAQNHSRCQQGSALSAASDHLPVAAGSWVGLQGTQNAHRQRDPPRAKPSPPSFPPSPHAGAPVTGAAFAAYANVCSRVDQGGGQRAGLRLRFGAAI